MPITQRTYYQVVFLLLILSKSTILPANDKSKCKIARNQAEKNISELAYIKAIENYTKLVKWECANIADLRNLANAYFQLKDTQKSELYYREIVESDEAIAEDYYYYAQSLKSNEKYAESEKWLKQYQEISYANTKIISEQSIVEEIKELNNKNTYTVTPLSINSKYSDFGAIPYNNGLLFISARQDESLIQFESSLNDEPFLDIYLANFNGEETSVIPFSKDINSRFHDGPVCFNSDGSEIFVTRSRFNKKSKKNDFVLYHAYQKKDGWGNLEELPFNSREYSCGHPCLTADNKVLFFASDVPGGYGGADIYFTQKETNGWSMPTNLGPNINTEGEEMFPFISANSDLYFSSNGHPGLGGLDIYLAQTDMDGLYEAVNLGAPLNSSSDDFSFYLDKNGTEGYFASNREGGMGSDDIYKFVLNKDKIYTLAISTKNSSTGNNLPNVTIQLINEEGKPVGQKTSNNSGKTDFEVELEKKYQIKALKDNYKKRTIDFQSEKDKMSQNTFYLTIFLTSTEP